MYTTDNSASSASTESRCHPFCTTATKSTFDTRLVTPQEGAVVAVYDGVRGGIIGYWRRGANDWGTVTRIVDTPVRPRRPHRG